MDGYFGDWLSGLPSFAEADVYSGVNLNGIQVTNDDNYLYLKLTASEEFDLHDNLIPHTTWLYLDTDMNGNTGSSAATGFGAEIGINFRLHYVNFYATGLFGIDFSTIGLRTFPSYTSDTFEIAISRNAMPDESTPLFSGNNIKILFRNTANSDYLPNIGTFFTYSFNNNSIGPVSPISLEKENPSAIRVIAYNTNGRLSLTDSQDNYGRILPSVNPDIIALSECYLQSELFVKDLVDSWLPLPGYGWYVTKDDYDMMICSRWPFIQTWDTPDRQYAALIHLPDYYTHDLLLINAHLQCCSDDATRQTQCDEIISFIADAKNPGGEISIPQNTPILYAGDLNLVGYSQQLTTLLTGDIQDNLTYGSDAAPDWDNSSFTDEVCRNTALRMCYTWRDDGDSYPPARMDYFLYSDAVMSVAKSFILETEEMTSNQLMTNGLEEMDTWGASDHFPVIADFLIETIPLSDSDGDLINDPFDNCPSVPNALQADFNLNGTGDACEDTDGDFLSDETELTISMTDPEDQDTDDDGLTDQFEIQVTQTDPLNADSDNNGCNDGVQLAGQCGTACPADLNHNGLIDVNDLIIFISVYGSSCD